MGSNENSTLSQLSSPVFLLSPRLCRSSASSTPPACSTIEQITVKDNTENDYTPLCSVDGGDARFCNRAIPVSESSFSLSAISAIDCSDTCSIRSEHIALQSAVSCFSYQTSTSGESRDSVVGGSRLSFQQPNLTVVSTLQEHDNFSEEIDMLKTSKKADSSEKLRSDSSEVCQENCDGAIGKEYIENYNCDNQYIFPPSNADEIEGVKQSTFMASSFSIPAHVRVSEKEGKELVNSLMKPCDVEGQRFLEYMNSAELQENDEAIEDESANCDAFNGSCINNEKIFNNTNRNNATNHKNNFAVKSCSAQANEKPVIHKYNHQTFENKIEKKTGFLKGLFGGVGGVTNGWRKPTLFFGEKNEENLVDRREFEIVNENDERQNDQIGENVCSSIAMNDISAIPDFFKNESLQIVVDEKDHKILAGLHNTQKNSEDNVKFVSNDKKTEFERLLEKSYTCASSPSALSASTQFCTTSSAAILAKENKAFGSSSIAVQETPLTKQDHVSVAASRSELLPPPPSQKPRTPYNVFLEKLKHSSCKHVVAALRQFVENFPRKLTIQNAANFIHPFLSRMKNALLMTEVFSPADDQNNSVIEGLEKFVIQKLHPRLFATEKFDDEQDKLLFKKIRCLQWVEFDHLEIPPLNDSGALWSLAVSELNRLDKMKAPRDKIVLILNCCRVVVNVLANQAKDDGTRKMPCADDILPLLIYVIIKTNPPQLHSNIEFIQNLRHPSILISEDAYFFTQFCSAVAFIRDVGETETAQLHISREEYNRRFKEAEREYMKELNVQQQKMTDKSLILFSGGILSDSAVNDLNNQNKNQEKATFSLTNSLASETSCLTASIATSGTPPRSPNYQPVPANILLLEKQNAELYEILKYISGLSTRYETLKSVRDLRVGDLPLLFEEYQQLVEMKNKFQKFLISLPCNEKS